MILALAWYYNVLGTLFGFLAIFLMMVILLQRGKGVGLAGAFGGAGGQTAFGSKTGDVLTWATVVIAGIFLLFAVGMNYLFAPIAGGLGAPSAVVAPTSNAPPPSATPISVPDDDSAPFSESPAPIPSPSDNDTSASDQPPESAAPPESTEDPPAETP